MIEGRLTAAQVMETRRDAMAATTPGIEPAARWAFAVLALTVSAVAALLCLWCGVVAAQAIGASLLFGDSDSAFFAGLLDELATWWDLLGPTGQILVTALGVTLLMTAGSTFALAMGATGVLTWAAAHGHGLASYLNNPAAATSSYLSNVTAGQLAWDLIDFALTFIPGSALGAGAHTIARTTARDMAATRTALRQGGKKATQATEQTAARTEARPAAAGSRGAPPKKNGSHAHSRNKPRPGGPFPDVQSMRGRPAEDILDIIPDDWIVGTPKKEPNGIKFENPHVRGEVIMYEPGWPDAWDPVHAGPYLRVSEGGRKYRIPLKGNPAL